MRQFNEFSGLWRAPLFSKAFYQDVALNWRGIAARYLLLLMALTWLVGLIYWTIHFAGIIENDIRPAFKDFPTITIAKGVASSDVPQPYILKDDHGKPFFVFDTTGQITEPNRNGPMFVMTRTELLQSDARGNVQRHALSQFPDAVVDQQWFVSWAYVFRNWMIPGGTVCCGGGSFVMILLLGLLLAVIGLPLNNAFHGGLKYQALLRLALVSMTGPVFLMMLLWMVMEGPSLWEFFVFPLVAVGYMVFAVKAAASVVPEGFPITSTTPTPPPLPGQPPQTPPDFDERFP